MSGCERGEERRKIKRKRERWTCISRSSVVAPIAAGL
jgi:hypothetical protein